MDNRRKMGLAGMALAIGALVATTNKSEAAQFQFFGEDEGLGERQALTTFPNATGARDDFLAQLVGVGTEDFEGFSAGNRAPQSLLFPGAGTATITGDGQIKSVPEGSTNGFGRYATSGTNFWEVTGVFEIEFDEPVAAFGFHGVDVGDFNGQLTLTFENGSKQTVTVPNTQNGQGGSVMYFGFIDTENSFTKVTFGNTNSGTDYFAFDDMTIGSLEQIIGNNVPDDGSSRVFAAFGLFAIAGLSRRVRQVRA